MEAFGLNAHHDNLIVDYLRFAQYQRGQCKKSVESCFRDVRETRLLENTYTVEEIQDVIDDLRKEVLDEVDNELINSTHTNVLLLQQVFKQAQKWHLNLDADLAELENRELLDKVKRWEEESAISSELIDKPVLSHHRLAKLAPLNESGPVPLLQAQISQLQEENRSLKEKLDDQSETFKSEVIDTTAEKDNELNELSETVKSFQLKLQTEKEMNQKSQLELEGDLSTTKSHLVEVRHQLVLAEKELERKFSETGAYKNLKKMLASKNDQIKELRSKLKQFENGSD